MQDDELLERIRQYIRQNQATFTLPALRARLLKDGVPADAVDRVIAEFSGSPYYGPPPGQGAGPASASTWSLGKFFGVLTLGVLFNIGVIVAASAIFAYTESTFAFAGFGALALAAEVVVAVRSAKTSSAVTAGLIVAICVTPVVVGILLLGACLVIIASLNA